jgi:hypothetical protein
MSKFLVNLAVKFLKVLPKSKFIWNSKSNFYLNSLLGPAQLAPSQPSPPRRPPLRPTSPTSPRANGAITRVCFPLWTAPSIRATSSLPGQSHVGPTCQPLLLSTRAAVLACAIVDACHSRPHSPPNFELQDAPSTRSLPLLDFPLKFLL